MQHGTTAPRRFGPTWVAAQRAKLDHRPAEGRQLTYDIAVQDEYAPWRQWLDDQLALLPEDCGDALAGRVWLDEHFWTVIFELAAGAALPEAGYTAAYERPIDGMTPDWTALGPNGQPLFLLEVHTDNPAKETFSQMRAWHGLVERIKQIPVPVVLQLASTGGPDGPIPPPDAGTAKRIARDLRAGLLALWQPNPPAFTTCGYTFLVMADPRGGRRMSPLGLRACFIPPSSRAGVVSPARLLDNVTEKVAKYRGLADQHGLPLAVAAGAHKFTGVTLDGVDLALTGSPAPVLTWQFDEGDTWFEPITVENKPVQPWAYPPDLAALFWIDHQWPFQMTARPNPGARRPLTPSSLLNG